MNVHIQTSVYQLPPAHLSPRPPPPPPFSLAPLAFLFFGRIYKSHVLTGTMDASLGFGLRLWGIARRADYDYDSDYDYDY